MVLFQLFLANVLLCNVVSLEAFGRTWQARQVGKDVWTPGILNHFSRILKYYFKKVSIS